MQKGSVIKDMGLYGLVGVLAVGALALYLITMLWADGDARDLASAQTAQVLAAAQRAQTPEAQELLRYRLVALATSAQHESALHEILFHISLALAVAAVLLLLVEIRVKRLNEIEMNEYKADMSARIDQYKSAIADNVWNAVSGQIVPPEVVAEIRRMLGISMIRRDCNYTITLDRAPEVEGMKVQESMLVRRRLTYTINNLAVAQNEPYHWINSSFDGLAGRSDKRGKTYPRFSNFAINKCTPKEFGRDPNPTRIRHQVPMTDEPIKVLIESEELYAIEDHIVYIQTVPAIGLTVDIINSLRDELVIADVTLNGHAPDRQLEPVAPSDGDGCCAENRWEYAGAILPGQGFSITTRKRLRKQSQDSGSAVRTTTPSN